ncbi:MAG: deiodinase [Chloroflexi bacterium]|nr:deiodinase [Chloroflexota bacterium]
MQELHHQYGDRVEFLIVYIQEAHPSDGWEMQINVEENIVYAQPKSFDEREHVAEACSLELKLEIPTLIDDMEDSTDLAYSALPDRLYLIGTDGRIAYRSERGPMGFRPEELEAAITSYLASA